MEKLDKNLMNELCDLAGLPMTESTEPDVVVEAEGSAGVIKALRDTDYKDKDAFFKMVQLLKGMAVASEKDEKAKKFMSAVSDALTTAAKKVLGESEELDEGRMYPRSNEDAASTADDIAVSLNSAMAHTSKARTELTRHDKELKNLAEYSGSGKDGKIARKVIGMVKAMDSDAKSIESEAYKAYNLMDDYASEVTNGNWRGR